MPTISYFARLTPTWTVLRTPDEMFYCVLFLPINSPLKVGFTQVTEKSYFSTDLESGSDFSFREIQIRTLTT